MSERPPEVVALPHREPAEQEGEAPRRPYAAQDKERQEAQRRGGEEVPAAGADGESGADARAADEAGADDDAALPAEVPADVAPVTGDELEELGLLWLANRVLHPLGYALIPSSAVMAMRTDDPMGFEYEPLLELEGRQRLRALLEERRQRPQEPT